jgi:hypothetical protein
MGSGTVSCKHHVQGSLCERTAEMSCLCGRAEPW